MRTAGTSPLLASWMRRSSADSLYRGSYTSGSEAPPGSATTVPGSASNGSAFGTAAKDDPFVAAAGFAFGLAAAPLASAACIGCDSLKTASTSKLRSGWDPNMTDVDWIILYPIAEADLRFSRSLVARHL